MIEVKYGSLRCGWCSLAVVGSYGVSVLEVYSKGMG